MKETGTGRDGTDTGREMAMYQTFLEVALDEGTRRHRGLRTSELEAAVLDDVEAGRRLLAQLDVEADAAGTIAANVNYDAALILLGRAWGLECDTGRFTRPGSARATLEASLLAGGVRPPTGSRPDGPVGPP